MKKPIHQLAHSIVILCFLTACSSVPISGRKQLNLLPESEMIGMSLTNYNDFLTKNPPINTSDANAQLVTRVGSKIANAVEQYLRQNSAADRIANFKWEFKLVNDKTVNAWCMPGGKVVVYTGLLGVTQDEASLAVVLGHEIAHAVARHGNERMSQGMVTELGGMALNVALSQKAAETQQLFMTAYGVGTNVGIMLPFSRTHESEADKLGLVFMAMAGYNPQVATQFWRRMAQSGGAKPPEFLSTHPSDETRIKDIEAYLPTAMKHYSGASNATTPSSGKGSTIKLKKP